MHENPRVHWNRLVERIKPNRPLHSIATESDFPLVLVVREFSIENARRKLMSRCGMFGKLGIALCVVSAVCLIFGYSILAMGFILLGAGITLFSEIWKRYLPKSNDPEQLGVTNNRSDLTNINLLPVPTVLPNFSREQRQESGPFVSSVTTFEIEQFFDSGSSLTNKIYTLHR